MSLADFHTIKSILNNETEGETGSLFTVFPYY